MATASGWDAAPGRPAPGRAARAVARNPLPRLGTAARLWAAAVASVVPLGTYWSSTSGTVTPGFTMYGDCGYSSGPYCTPNMYVPGYFLPGHTITVVQTPLRAFLVCAAIAFVLAALSRRTPATRALVRAATLALGWAALYAVAHDSADVAALALLALALTVPLVWKPPGWVRWPAVLARGDFAG